MYYSNKIDEIIGKNVLFTMKDYKISFIKDDFEFSADQLSSGEKEIVAFIFRLAILNNIFKDDKPFLIFDDPFVNLDKNNFEKISKIFNELCNDRQIIYLTCHESRKISV